MGRYPVSCFVGRDNAAAGGVSRIKEVGRRYQTNIKIQTRIDDKDQIHLAVVVVAVVDNNQLQRHQAVVAEVAVMMVAKR